MMNSTFTPIFDFLQDAGLSHFWASVLRAGILILILFALAGLMHLLGQKLFLRFVSQFTKKSKTSYDDILLKNHVFKRLSLLFPALVIFIFDDVVLIQLGFIKPLILGATNIYLIVTITSVVDALLKSLQNILENKPAFSDKPLNSYRQLFTILLYGVATILIVSILIDKSPMYLFSALGALTAVILLVFKDSLLGFVASIQLSSNDMIRIGDWVTVSEYGADGTVLEINLNTVKIQNFDNTITTVPTYAFISNSFRNWRAMQESGGRRIKRNIYITMDSIQFCDNELLNKLEQVDFLESFIKEKQVEIAQYNETRVKHQTVSINGRRLTNVGLFRKYLEVYLESNPRLNTKLTTMVRQLEPNAKGLPLQVYCFSAIKEWVEYEEIQSDIFDHIFASAQYFDLELFQDPTGRDFKSITQ